MGRCEAFREVIPLMKQSETRRETHGDGGRDLGRVILGGGGPGFNTWHSRSRQIIAWHETAWHSIAWHGIAWEVREETWVEKHWEGGRTWKR
jgi:hypothetical protein